MSTLANKISERDKSLRTMSSLLMQKNQSAEIRSQYAKLEASVAELESDIAMLRTIEAGIAEGQRELAKAEAQEQRTKTNLLPEIAAHLARHSGHTSSGDRKADESRAWAKYLKTGEVRDISTLTDVSGGAFIPQETAKQFVSAVKETGSLSKYVKFLTEQSGRPVKQGIYDDTANFAKVVSESNNTVERDPTLFSQVTSLTPLITRVDYSYQFGDDAQALTEFLNEIAAVRIARSLEYAIALNHDPAGNVLSLGTGQNAGLLVSPTSAGTLATPGTVALADIQKLYASVDNAYRNNKTAAFFGHQTTVDQIAGLTGSDGRLLFHFDADGDLVVYGRKVLVSPAFPSLGTTGAVVQLGFGDLSKSVVAVLRDFRIQVTKETHADVFVNSAYISARFGSSLTNNAQAFKVLQS